ncbi:MAG: PKD domain-containing protein, partial [Anaerolineales bacterium]|nr:PKD domain-containing protein [Anaerolineales bacterium]
AVNLTVDSVNDDPLVNAGADASAIEGQTVSFSGAYSDPGRLLTAVEILWRFGDGATLSGSLTPSHTYADDGLYNITLTITDEQGAASSDFLLLTVENAAPTIAPLPDAHIALGNALTLTVAFTDPGLLDTHTLAVAWGDGSTASINLSLGARTYELRHTFTSEGAFHVSLTITDDDNASASTGLTATVERKAYLTRIPLILK